MHGPQSVFDISILYGYTLWSPEVCPRLTSEKQRKIDIRLTDHQLNVSSNR